jgi:UDP-N-acetylmuramyl pentapeptide phosphotransferase/UDP-N-acetylglucosamine-1-phosphate transferase
MTMTDALVVIVPACLAAGLIAGLRHGALARSLEDRPNERSLHESPRARVGGIGLMAAAVPVALFASGAALAWPLALACALAVVSFFDDRRSLPIGARLVAHLACAVFVAQWACAGCGCIAIAIAVLAVAWMTNLFNFMDGADGLAGGMGLIGFGTLAVAAYGHDDATAWTCAALASACAGFLVHNFPPARVFMGDAGSIPLGFLAGALGVHGAANGTWPAWLPILAFGPFILDASITLARRVLSGEAFWRAHRKHAYQRLVLAGWSHRRLALAAYAVMLLSSACALWVARAGGVERSVILCGWAAMMLLLFVTLERRLRRAAPLSIPGKDP